MKKRPHPLLQLAGVVSTMVLLLPVKMLQSSLSFFIAHKKMQAATGL